MIRSKAIRVIAEQYVINRRKQSKIENEYMGFDCKFTDNDMEMLYCSLGETANELQLMCCGTMEECTEFSEIVKDLEKKFSRGL